MGHPNFAPGLAKYGGVTPDDFPLPSLRYVYPTPYSDEIVADTYHWTLRWGLLTGEACAAHLVDNRMPQPALSCTGN